MQLRINNHYLRSFEADAEESVFPRQVMQAFSFVSPQVTQQPKLIAFTEELLAQLAGDQRILPEKELAQLLSGNRLMEGMQPYAMNYGGHQFGHWAGQLGDGRAINLAQVDTDHQGNLTLQLKGAGLTPYSRSADGLAVLRSSIREFLCSEAMYHLGIPTTRALSLCLTGDLVQRDMFYDGNPKAELGAVVCRVSPCFLRFGSYQLPAYRRDKALLKQLIDYTVKHHFPHLGKPSTDVYLQLFKEVCQRTCQLVIHWMRVGFVHGVLNTDNMSIIGETIDYGPYGWVDNFDPNWTPNTTDAQGKRYRFGAQAEICQWNLYQLANALYLLVEQAEPLNQALDDYARQYNKGWREMMLQKLGLTDEGQKPEEEFILTLQQLLTALNIDMTLFYRRLADFASNSECTVEFFEMCFYQFDQLTQSQINDFQQWLRDYQQLLRVNAINDESRKLLMNQVNPKYVLRNYLAQQAIEAAEQGDYQMLEQLQEVLKKPYDEQPTYQHLAQKRPDWALNKAGCSMLSCSS